MKEVFLFECRFQLRSPLFWSMALLFFLLAFFAMASEDVSVGGVGPNLNLNASYAIVQTQYVFSILIMFAGISFVAGAITRDYEARTAELLFASGVRERDYYLGRLAGGLLFCTLVAVAALLGTLVGSLMPWLDPDRMGPFAAGPYLYSLLVIILPNALIVSGLFYVVAGATRSMLAAYLAALGFTVLYVILGSVSDPETLKQYSMLDPFGIIPFQEQTRYWTAFERNAALPQVDGSVLQGRLLWIFIALALLALGCRSYSFSLSPGGLRRRRRPEVPAVSAADAQPAVVELPTIATSEVVRVPQGTGFRIHWAQFVSQLHMDVRGILRSVPFYVLLAFGLFNTLGAIVNGIEMAYGTPVYPVTRLMIDAARGSFSLVLLIVVIYYAGELVHRERQANLKQIVDATPYPSGIMIAAKVLALWFVLVMMLVVVTLTSMAMQALHGYTNFELGLYAIGLFGVVGMDFYLLAILSVVVQVFSPNKFLGMLAVLILFIGFQFMSSVGFEHYLYRFEVPYAPYSDMNGFGHYQAPLWSFSAYWLLWGGLLVLLAHLFFQRGMSESVSARLATARARISKGFMILTAVVSVACGAIGAFIFYNTNVLNDYQTSDERNAAAAEYERRYVGYKDRYLPQLESMTTEVDIFPAERRLESRGSAQVVNRHSEALAEVMVTLAPELKVNRLTLGGEALEPADQALGVWFYRPQQPLAPGAEAVLEWNLSWLNPGFPNSGATNRVVANGTFVNNTEIMPVPGYDSSRELQDNNERREHDLGPLQRMPKLGDPRWLGFNMFGISQRSGFKTVVSTSADQIALAPGYLQREWREGDRRYFEYEMDVPIWPFVSYTSARYEVTKEQWGEQSLEVYYHPDHHWNVETMLRASRDSLSYFSEVFSPFQYRQFRIIEFPRYQSFAQSFPNTIPYSEAIGFTADLSDPEDVDFVYYVTAHEAAHQWWGHQLAGAQMQGVSALSETLSQYSALMVMEREYGAPMMRRFLKRELDRYLLGRGGELIEELPLALVEGQPYIHYRKGSLVMYDLKTMLGEVAVNRALRRLIERFAYAGAPFATTTDLLDELRKEATLAQRQRIDDLFERITLYEFEVSDADIKQVADGYEVQVTVDATKYYADGEGRETEAPLSESVLIGLFPEKGEGLSEVDLPEPILLEPRDIVSGQQTFVFTVAEPPVQVGVDPYVYRVDRNPDNNLRRL
ncbi:MAG: M1 family aminopeptidase [Pseudomonadales bacterium]